MTHTHLSTLPRLAVALGQLSAPAEVLREAGSRLDGVLAPLDVAFLQPVGPDLVSTLASARCTLSADALTALDPAGAVGGRIIGSLLPPAWPTNRHAVSCHELAPAAGWLLTAGARPLDESTMDWLEAAASLIGAALARTEATEHLEDLRLRVDNAQQLANMGDYDWHIPSDTNTWSNQLYRIYGHPPQSFNASYERFLELIHPDDREMIQGVHQQAYATGEPYQMIERIVRPDGELRYLASNGQVIMDESGTPVRMRGTCIDITSRVLAERAGEELSAKVREAQIRRRQALEINDNVVQGLVSAVYAADQGDAFASSGHIRATLAAARQMMDDLLDPLDGDDLQPGDLVRSSAATTEVTVPLSGPDGVPPVPGGRTGTSYRVVIADDSADIRHLLSTVLELTMKFAVVDQVGDGRAAVKSVLQHRPDVVLLDLAMPVLDGFQALGEIRQVAPDTAVVVLSGFDARSMQAKALAEGADAYVEKGRALDELEQVLRDTLRARRVTH